jgi:hypothetical protein
MTTFADARVSTGSSVTLLDFAKHVRACEGWKYESDGDAYCFLLVTGNVQKISREYLLGVDSRLPPVLDYFGPYQHAVDNLVRTIDIWCNVTKMVYWNAFNDRSLDILCITEVAPAVRGAFCMQCRCYRVDKLPSSQEIWVAGPDVEHSAEFTPSEDWINRHFHGGVTRLKAAVSLGLDASATAALLYQETGDAGALDLPGLDSADSSNGLA